MIDGLLAWLAAVIVAVISASGLTGIALLMAIESACIPLPSEIIMPFSGYLASTGRFSLILVATAGALGCNLGSSVAYFVGYRGGRPIIERWGGYILMSHQDLDQAERFFARFGSLAVFIARLLPVVRTFIALPAGIARMPQLKFQIYTFLGSWPWCFALAWIGYRLGQAWESDPRLRAVMHRLDLLAVLAIVLAVVWYLRRHWRQRVGRRIATPETPASLSAVPKRK
ncbi:MAG TPA: DedA family protein [Candidatus Udaeobacter sp.]|nr:DedA family protein [Candidatus Udaeobacter sp.]